MSHRTRSTVTAAFAHEGSAAYARRLIGGALDISVTYDLRNVLNERGTVEMVVLEATLADPLQAGRVETLMTGANGMLIPTGDAAVALRAS
jgi:hypothetical protein